MLICQCDSSLYPDVADEEQCPQLLVIKCGVPQGSTTGPLLFIISVNGITTVTKQFHPIIYADDTTLMHVQTTAARILIGTPKYAHSCHQAPLYTQDTII
jgi:hypothetical protein